MNAGSHPIGEFFLSRPARPRIVAEIGTAHGGDPDRARELIAAARSAGADTAKFQLVRAEEILHPASGHVTLPGGSVALYERFRELERPEHFYANLKAACDAEGIGFLCTPFGIESARILRRLGAHEIKIASPELNHVPLLREVSSYGLPLILSTGVAQTADIAESLSVLPTGYPVQLLHCVTAYPAPAEDYNLRALASLRAVFGVPVGVSDHSVESRLVPVLAALLGASMIEKHITLSQEDDGLDDPIALEPKAFSEMVASIRNVVDRMERAWHNGETAYLQQFHLERDALDEEFGAERIETVLGSPVKRLAPSEARNYGRTNRSIHALRSLAPGDRIDSSTAAVLRSEKNLSPGLHPRYWDLIQGKQLVSPVADGEGIHWRHLLA